MRDYKNVKVPRKYRSQSSRTTIKQLKVRRTSLPTHIGSGTARHVAGIVTVLVIIVGSILSSWYLYREAMHAEMFQISGVDIRGAHQLDEASLKKIVGVFKGENIFRVDLDAAIRRARMNPWVKAVSIYRRLPNRISMTLTERIPYAFLDTSFGRYMVDDEGVIIETVERDRKETWPLPLIAIKNYRGRLGEQITSETLEEALLLLSEITKRSGWHLAEVTIKASTPEELSIVYADHEFKLGSGRYTEKLRRLAEVMEDIKRRGLNFAYVDLRPDRQVAVLIKSDKGKVAGQADKKKVQK